MTRDLFNDWPALPAQSLGTQAMVLRGFALADADALLGAIDAVLLRSPLRTMMTPGRLPMSVATSSCGDCGWITDAKGYRYVEIDPKTGDRWPPMPDVMRDLAVRAADAAGFAHFAPDSCLINVYATGAKMSLHQDRDERDLRAPIVSVSLGVPAVFLFGGQRRTDPTQRVALTHGDIVVWGGDDRLRFHGVMPVRDATHPRLGTQRINLTFRRAR